MVSEKRILDCSSLSTTFSCFETVLQKKRESIVLDLIKCEDVVEQSNYSVGETLYYEFFNSEKQHDIFDAIVFFHLSKTAKHSNYIDKGVLPTKSAIDIIWQDIKLLLKQYNANIDLKVFRKKLESDKESTYYFKLNVDSDGPYAFLTQETAFNRSDCNKFLETPEIVEDILREIEDRENIKLYKHYRELGSPCIVKFYVIPNQMQDDKALNFIGAGLEYLYWHSIGEPSSGLDIGFDGNGKSIPPEQILHIQKL